MKIDKLTKMYFSPTNTTRTVIEEISKEIEAKDTRTIDLTKLDVRKNFNPQFDVNEIIVMGIPVYGMRIPKILLPYLKKLEGNNNPVILVSVYGNASEGILLKQLDYLLRKKKFKVIGASSFIGEHSFSYSYNKIKLANGRPDFNDLCRAEEFGKRIKKKLRRVDNYEELFEVEITDESTILSKIIPSISKIIPIEGAKMFAKIPELNKSKCNSCKKCANSCSVRAINYQTLKINKKLCLRCYACAKKCPLNARKIDFNMEWLVNWFLNRKGKNRKEPRFYL